MYYKRRGYPKGRKVFRDRDPEVVRVVSEISANKPTYGTPRVLAILKRDYFVDTTRYQVYMIMKECGLLIKSRARLRYSREHTGRVMVKQSNKRWASDITQIKTWSGEKIRFTYVLDCCDRSIIAWRAGKHMQAADIEGMFQEALINRFGDTKSNGLTLEFLHDNGPEYIEKTFQKTLK